MYLFTADNASIPASPSSSPSSTNQVIPTVEKLILALPSITDPCGFGLRLGITFDRCNQLISKHGKDTIAQMRAIAAEWYEQTPRNCFTWNKVVKALYEHGLVRDAVDLAKEVGVESPLPKENGDSDHH